jgi:hypothetical protein
VLERLLDAQRLDTLFERTAVPQDTREFMFSSLVQPMSEVVLGVQPSVHAAYQAHKEAIGVSTTALYNKLDRVETGVAAELVRDSAQLAEPVILALRASRPPLHWAVFRAMSDREFADALCELASAMHLSRYRKHPRSPKKKPPQRTAYQSGSHVSTARLIAQR